LKKTRIIARERESRDRFRNQNDRIRMQNYEEVKE